MLLKKIWFVCVLLTLGSFLAEGKRGTHQNLSCVKVSYYKDKLFLHLMLSNFISSRTLRGNLDLKLLFKKIQWLVGSVLPCSYSSV